MRLLKILFGLFALYYSSLAYAYLYENNFTIDPHENQVTKFDELLPGEMIDIHSGDVGHYLETVSIEGNGLPIKLGHRHRKDLGYDKDLSAMSLEVPQIEFNHMGAPIYMGTDQSETGNGDAIVVAPYQTNIKCNDLKLLPDSYVFFYNNHPDPDGVPLPQDPNSILSSGIKLKLGYGAVNFFPKDHDLSGRFPASAKYISPSNWYIECVASPNVTGSNAFKAVSPDGLTYIFDIYQEAQVHGAVFMAYPEPAAEAKIYVSSITDKHGNSLKYEYERLPSSGYVDGVIGDGFEFLYDRARIKAIYDPVVDGRRLDINYLSNNQIELLSNSSNPVKLIYSDQSDGSMRITRKDGKYWEYRYTHLYDPIHQTFWKARTFLTKITYPNGLSVDYTYYFDKNYVNREYSRPVSSVDTARLHTRTVSGPGMLTNASTYQYVSKSGGYNTIFVQQPSRSIEYRYGVIDLVWSPNSTPVDSGKLVRKVIYKEGTTFANRSADKILKQVDYTYSRVGHVIDLDYLTTNWNTTKNSPSNQVPYRDLLTSTHESYQTVVSTKQTQINGYTFTEQKSGYDLLWGNPETITETNTLGKSRVTTTLYHNDTTNWIIGKPRDISIAGETAKTEIEYYETGPVGSIGEIKSKSVNGIVEHYTYHADGNLKQINMYKDTVLKQSHYYGDYYRGIAQEIYDGMGNRKDVVVYDFGKIQSETDFNGNPPTTYLYDNIHRLEKIIPPIEAATHISWPTEVQKVSEKSGYRQTIDYNALMQPLLVTEEDTTLNEKRYLKTTYDASGRVHKASFPSYLNNEPVGRTYSYDALNRPLTVTHTGDNSQTTYCYGSNCSNPLVKHGHVMTDARGYDTVQNYIAYGNPNEKELEEIHQQKDTSPSYILTKIERGKHGQIFDIQQGGEIRTFTYKTGKLLLDTKKEPEIGTTYYLDYDERGNLKQKQVENSGITKIRYDNNDRVDFIDYPGTTPDVDYVYLRHNLDQLITVNNGINETAWEYDYDDLNKITSEVLNVDGLTFNVTYTYDNLGNLDSFSLPRIENPAAPRIVDVTVDALGRTRSINGYVSNINYYANGVISDMQYNNGYNYTGTLNPRYLPKNIHTTDGVQELVNLTYGYDRTNNILSIDDYVQINNNRTMSYDGLGRLETVDGRWNKDTWGLGTITYDDDHDIKSLTVNGQSSIYDYIDNRLTSITGTGGINRIFTYGDWYGNVTDNGTDTFIYDDANQLQTVSSQGINYLYDGNKKRVKVVTVTPSKTVYYVYNQAEELQYRYDLTNEKDVEYINLNGKLIAKLEGGPSVISTFMPDIPGGFTAPATDTNGSYTVSWNASSNATRYELQERKNGGAWTLVHNASATSKAVSGKGNGTYDYRVRACNSISECSWYSTIKTTVVLWPPAAPTGLSAPSSNGTGAYTISWNASSTATSYQLQEQKNHGSWSTIYTGGSRSKSVSAKGIGTYDYRVRACNSSGCGSYSGEKRTVISSPAMPGSISAPAQAHRPDVRVSWPAISGATRYELDFVKTYSSSPPASGWTNQYNGSSTYYDYWNYGCSNTYGFFRVRACNSVGCSGYRNSSRVIMGVDRDSCS